MHREAREAGMGGADAQVGRAGFTAREQCEVIVAASCSSGRRLCPRAFEIFFSCVCLYIYIYYVCLFGFVGVLHVFFLSLFVYFC